MLIFVERFDLTSNIVCNIYLDIDTLSERKIAFPRPHFQYPFGMACFGENNTIQQGKWRLNSLDFGCLLDMVRCTNDVSRISRK